MAEKTDINQTKYKASIELFIAEGHNHWNRFYSMLTANILLITLGGLSLNKDSSLKIGFLFPLISIFGLILCILWFLMTERGFIWMNHWIKEASKLEGFLEGEVYPLISGKDLKDTLGHGIDAAASKIVIVLVFLLHLLVLVWPSISKN